MKTVIFYCCFGLLAYWLLAAPEEHAAGFWLAVAVLIAVAGFVVIAVLSGRSHPEQPAQAPHPQQINHYHGNVYYISTTAATLAALGNLLSGDTGRPLNGRQKQLLEIDSDD